ncbi:sulfatase [Gramella sp. AN32]|uniref:Sulfatase n=1 Tax=Christiangramia antarctica TaxID=2058158 RepID=A0ABW5X3B0_9FLAO|nr:sulfatase [Gramella sp. AN32]MCM4155799.1 hypothetical protein [Gramella sp. AN32]
MKFKNTGASILFLITFIAVSCGSKPEMTEKNIEKIAKREPEKPNFLWLVVEDMSPFLSMYSNKYTTTPTLDSLAQQGLVFTHAYSNGAQCSPARSTLISGIYAPMLATDWHRQKRPVPQEFYYPKYLKDAGYYATNNSKEDYNASNRPDNIWTESSRKATYLNRENKEQPFFAVFNYNGTHTQRVATRDTTGRKPRTIALDSVDIPPYLPDESLIRNDIAWYYDSINEMDLWVKKQLDELRASGELENTIIFFYSDHGGCLPRGKAYVYDTGTHVPLIVNAPEKYQDMLNVKYPGRDDRLVGFADFAPTIFNLAGIQKPDFMMGQPFLGSNQPEPNDYIFTFRANQEQSFIPSRSLTDGRYRLIWNFNSAYPNGTRQSYQWQMPSYQGWDHAYIDGKTNTMQSEFWEPTTALQFFDTENDPWEVNNLIGNPDYQDKITAMKTKLISFMKENKDLGLYPWSMRRSERKQPFYDYVRETNQPVEMVIEAAAFASTATAEDLPQLKAMFKDTEPAVRYWASIGILQLEERDLLKSIPKEVYQNFNNSEENKEVRLLSAEILVKAEDSREALQYVLEEVKNDYFIAYATLQNLGEEVKPIEEELLALSEKKGINQFYIRSALINSGYLPYSAIWPGDSKR